MEQVPTRPADPRRPSRLRPAGSLFAFLSVAAVCLTVLKLAGTRTSVAAPAPADTPVYAQLSSPDTQDPKDTKPLIVQMTSNDALGGLTHSDKANTGEIKVDSAGVYFCVAAIQVGKNMKAGVGNDYLDVWIKQNGKDVDNSGCRQTIYDPSYTTVLVCQGIAECKAGDVFNVAIAASAAGKGLGIKAIKPTGEPVIPSIIFSMYKIK